MKRFFFCEFSSLVVTMFVVFKHSRLCTFRLQLFTCSLSGTTHVQVLQMPTAWAGAMGWGSGFPGWVGVEEVPHCCTCSLALARVPSALHPDHRAGVRMLGEASVVESLALTGRKTVKLCRLLPACVHQLICKPRVVLSLGLDESSSSTLAHNLWTSRTDASI